MISLSGGDEKMREGCLDSMYSSLQIPANVKKLLAIELLNYPPLIRRELISNIMAILEQTADMLNFVSTMIERYLSLETVIEIRILKDLKLQRFSMEEVNALVEGSHVQN